MPRAAALAVAGDADNQITLLPDQNAASVTLTDHEKKSTTGPEGVASLFKNVRFLSIIGFVMWIPGVRGLLTKYLFPGEAKVIREQKGNTAATRSPAARS